MAGLDSLPHSSWPGLTRSSTWIPGTSPRLSGLAEVPLDCQLGWIADRWGLGVEQPVEWLFVHQIDAHETGEALRAGDGALAGLGETQQQKGDQRDRDLGAHGILTEAEEAGDFEHLLDPAEEQLDRPTSLVEFGDRVGRS